jgi:SpoVK/Ycf46/Vps4 family AAA+-type ATPase
MFWIYTQEPQLLNKNITEHEDIKNLNLPKNCLFLPSKEEIKENLKNKNNDFYVIHYASPTDFGFSEIGLFTAIEVKSDTYPFTQEQLDNNISKNEILQKTLGLRIVEPTVTLDDLAGAKTLKEDVEEMQILEDLGLMSISGLFLFGVAGAGKSFFAECFAGSTGRIFVVLDLPYFMSLPNPTKAIDEVFEFLINQKSHKYLLFIDEIEKMFDFTGGGGNLVSEQVFGKMLTWLNDIYGKADNNLCFVATANRIELLLQHKPEFVRKGRFDRLYFLNYPDIKTSAPEIFELYYEKYIKRIDAILDKDIFKPLIRDIGKEKLASFLKMERSFNINRIIRVIEGKLGTHKITDKDRLVYTPPEIKSIVESIIQTHIVETIKFLQKEKTLDIIQMEKINKLPLSIEDMLEKIVYKSPPLQVTAKEGILKQIAQAKSIKQGDKIAPFIEV